MYYLTNIVRYVGMEVAHMPILEIELQTKPKKVICSKQEQCVHRIWPRQRWYYCQFSDRKDQQRYCAVAKDLAPLAFTYPRFDGQVVQQVWQMRQEQRTQSLARDVSGH